MVMVSLRQLRYFLEVVDAGGFSAAAERLFVAQSALSRQISELEKELQAVLLERSSKGVTLTPAGRTFVTEARRVLTELEGSVALTRSVARGEQGTVRLAHSSSVPFAGGLPVALRAHLQANPGVTVDVSTLSSEQQQDEVEAGRIDLGLVRLPVLRPAPSLVCETIARERLLLLVASDHALADVASVSVAALAGEPFVSLPHRERGGLSYRVAQLCQQHGFFPAAAPATSRKATLVNLVAAGFGVAIVPESLAALAGPDVRRVALDDANADSEVALLRRRDAGGLVVALADALAGALKGP
ncbi:LysR substrate-binding domain-containing protein [Pandoraea commovens]|uniref:LysR family transcriptional regulator n=1 Tax=Pandoraea commovens TaxID=2508289 RepID=A0A5E4WNJ0_9BURK|nr:LysR substrate-binding domain-containing protein [Pandoraea commovens]UVA80662.1 LysR substrate-binding domain-containing protein [Pandoraea commovens]VVE25379.1 LysR family transcriptional regulator [Pandoraea commovens]